MNILYLYQQDEDSCCNRTPEEPAEGQLPVTRICLSPFAKLCCKESKVEEKHAICLLQASQALRHPSFSTNDVMGSLQALWDGLRRPPSPLPS